MTARDVAARASVCPVCNGKGYRGTRVSPLVAVVTVGWGLLADTHARCPCCHGRGRVE
jgi:RecJ-like exonuclease